MGRASVKTRQRNASSSGLAKIRASGAVSSVLICCCQQEAVRACKRFHESTWILQPSLLVDEALASSPPSPDTLSSSTPLARPSKVVPSSVSGGPERAGSSSPSWTCLYCDRSHCSPAPSSSSSSYQSGLNVNCRRQSEGGGGSARARLPLQGQGHRKHARDPFHSYQSSCRSSWQRTSAC